MKTLLISIFVCCACIAVQAQPVSPDKSFGNKGTIRFANTVYTIALDNAGKIVCSGIKKDSNDNAYHPVFTRYHPDGSLDTSFGVDGTIYDLDIKTESITFVIQPDNKILAGYYLPQYYYQTAYSRILLIRYNENGTLDSGFGNNGLIELVFSSTTNVGYFKMLLLEDGGFLLGVSENYHCNLMKYHSDGSIDSSFGNEGKVVFDGNDPIPFAIDFYNFILLKDGNILCAGRSGGITLFKIDLDGNLISSFGDSGNGLLSTGIPATETFDMMAPPDIEIKELNNSQIIVKGICDGNLLCGCDGGTLKTNASGGGKKSGTLTARSNSAAISAGGSV